MRTTIEFTINGKAHQHDVDVRRSLLEMLREDLGLLSVKQGCSVGECGACTVLIDDRPIDACLYLAVWVDGHAIRTVEGELRNRELSSIQKAFVDEGAVQCGICTPGFVMAGTALMEKNSGNLMTREEIRRGLAGNLCRCTGYDSIITAVEKCQHPKEEQ